MLILDWLIYPQLGLGKFATGQEWETAMRLPTSMRPLEFSRQIAAQLISLLVPVPHILATEISADAHPRPTEGQLELEGPIEVLLPVIRLHFCVRPLPHLFGHLLHPVLRQDIRCYEEENDFDVKLFKFKTLLMLLIS